jgi:fatty acid desaturase
MPIVLRRALVCLVAVSLTEAARPATGFARAEAQPILRAILIVEHSDCAETADDFANTRTTLASFPLRLLMRHMPFHAEHHLYPAVLFHQLPALHALIGRHLRHVAPSYPAVNREILGCL